MILPPDKPHIQIRKYNSDKLLDPLFELFPKNSKSAENKASFKDHKFLNKNIQNKIHLLDEMGFSSQIETRVDSNINPNSQLKRRFSIGISDFWAGPSKVKFLREKGYEEAFEELKKKAKLKDIVNAASLRKPDLPYLMDSNIKRRSSLVCDNGKALTARTKDNCVYLRNSEAKNEPLDSVVGRCNDLAQENFRLKQMGEKMQIELRQKAGSGKRNKRRISRKEKEMIAAIAITME